MASLFLGHATEVRLQLGSVMLRALAPADVRPAPGATVPIRIKQALLYA
jgi:hypothetical protein